MTMQIELSHLGPPHVRSKKCGSSWLALLYKNGLKTVVYHAFVMARRLTCTFVASWI